MRKRRRIPEPPYEVGYGKPPKHTRFKKGQSGNPRGRPKCSNNKKMEPSEERFQEILFAEAYREIEVREGKQSVTYPIAQVVIRTALVDAAKGHQGARKLVIEHLFATERVRKLEYDEFLKAAIDYKYGWEEELEDRERTGRTGPDPMPHPDDIEIQPRSGRVVFKGPMTKEEKTRCDSLRKDKKLFEDLANERRRMLKAETDPDSRNSLKDEIRSYEDMIAKIEKVIPD